MRTEAQSGLIFLKCSDIDSTSMQGTHQSSSVGADKESGHRTGEVLFKKT